MATLALCASELALVARAAQLSYDLERRLFLARGSGYVAISLLLATLAVTPLARAFHGGAKYRRPLGLATAAGALVHLGFVLALDGSILRLPLVLEPHSRTGLLALIILLLLAVTSFPRVVRALRLRLWKPLHRMVYGAAVLSLVHVAQSAFAPRRTVLLITGAMAFLLAIRVVRVWSPRRT